MMPSIIILAALLILASVFGWLAWEALTAPIYYTSLDLLDTPEDMEDAA
jgi:hypothetical protein